TDQLSNGLTWAGAARQIAHGDEFLTDYVAGLYNNYLHRPLDANGKTFYLGLFHQGFTAEQVKAEMLESNEYFNEQQKFGAGNYGFLFGMYRDVLGQTLDQTGIAFWGGQLAQGASPFAVALGIVSTPGALDRVVELAYQQYLGHGAGGGAAFW